ncbi:3-isopropylmalate dehydratase large subunit [uncultured Parasphingopyxis sp.]|uniref:3-isopropylmalate dehydratase large subunit n=1 Tax=uncultured Parasphingopyxis sp. TaxID=1547918 RepID=UPI002602374A|nr:3-isopropylmalate dehydratase large subunit [uncultured Parasphingopyxis sp.]
MSGRTLYDKIWDSRIVAEDAGETLLYVDLHLLHEVTSPQAFEGLRLAGRSVRRPERTLALADHNVPTEGQSAGLDALFDPLARAQLEALRDNSARSGIEHYAMGDPRGGIVHVVAPERGRTLPGMVIVCGDSHSSTHGAFGALAFGIGTSEIEHVLATQTIRQSRARNMRIRVDGVLPHGIGAKDLALHILARIGVDGALDHVVEFSGRAVAALSMEGRMTLCNMSVEMGARAGLVAPDRVTIDYLANCPDAPKGGTLHAKMRSWSELHSDWDAGFDREVVIDGARVKPMVSWGTTPAQCVPIGESIPGIEDFADGAGRLQAERALRYMNLVPGTPMTNIPIDQVFIGSCTNSRIEDLRAAADIARRGVVADNVRAIVVPGSAAVRRQAEAEGLDVIFRSAGFEWRDPGCSMCVGMNADKLGGGERCASTSNRNFEHRQGRDGRTHLMGPAMAAATAIAGTIADPRLL